MAQKCPPESGGLTLTGGSILITCASAIGGIHAKSTRGAKMKTRNTERM
jgi:hypothetical protein